MQAQERKRKGKVKKKRRLRESESVQEAFGLEKEPGSGRAPFSFCCLVLCNALSNNGKSAENRMKDVKV